MDSRFVCSGSFRALIALIVILGLHPQPVFDTVQPTIASIESVRDVDRKVSDPSQAGRQAALRVKRERTTRRESGRRVP